MDSWGLSIIHFISLSSANFINISFTKYNIILSLQENKVEKFLKYLKGKQLHNENFMFKVIRSRKKLKIEG